MTHFINQKVTVKTFIILQKYLYRYRPSKSFIGRALKVSKVVVKLIGWINGCRIWSFRI